jgi:hypothetical protein
MADKVASAPPRGVGWILAGDEGGYLQLQANAERKTKEKELGFSSSLELSGNH